MSTKSIILTLIGVIIIGDAVYFSMSKKPTNTLTNTKPVTTTYDMVTSQEPTKNTPTDEIIDYIVDRQSEDETNVAQVTLETSPNSVSMPSITTNF